MRSTLIVDDDDDVRVVVATLVETMGYQVLTAAKPKDALSIIERHPPDILITDVVMPEMSGYQLAQRAHEIRPDLPVVCMTAFPLLAGNDNHCTVTLRKPFRAAELRAALSRF